MIELGTDAQMAKICLTLEKGYPFQNLTVQSRVTCKKYGKYKYIKVRLFNTVGEKNDKSRNCSSLAISLSSIKMHKMTCILIFIELKFIYFCL